MSSEIWEEYLKRKSPICSVLTNEEWSRFLEKDPDTAMDMAIRLNTREILLEMGMRKRVPKHRRKKNPLDP